jgi:acyl carrier protein
MTQTAEEIIEGTRSYIIREFLPGESPDSLTTTTPLITSGILDSIGTVRLVSFLEEEYGVQLEAHEMGVDSLNTLADIAQLVVSKRG